MRGTTEGQMMYSRGTRDEQQRYSRDPTPNGEYIISKGLSEVSTQTSEAYEFIRETTVGLITSALTDLTLCYDSLKLN